LKGLAAHLELLSLVKHSPELFYLILYHLCGRLLPNERIGATETIPEVVNLTSLLADERCGAGVGFSLSNRSQSISCSGDRGIRINRCGRLGSVELSGSAALVSDIIAPLHFANDPMQQARSDHFVLAKLRRDVLKHGVAVGLRYGLAACINRSSS
jgi:hypothetical protein